MAVKDLPDYTREMIIKYTGGFIGLEELAARLGSIVPWDMKGNIVLAENFESELTDWYDGSDELGSTALRSSRHKYSGDWSVKLYNVGGADTEAILYRYFHFPGTTKYAAFTRFGWDEKCRKLLLHIRLYTGLKEFQIQVTYDLPTTTLSVLTTGDIDYEVTTSLTLSQSVVTWYPVLITFDLNTGYYDKLYVGDTEYDISSIALYYTEGGADPQGYIIVGALMGNAVPFTAYVDDIIIAKNVP